MSLPENAAPVSVDRISVKVPPFWADDPVLWFAQIENQFDLAGITQDCTKFNHVSSALDQRYATAVRDIIIKPPIIGKYEHLKAELIRRFSPSPEARIKRLFRHEELGDRKPSDFLFHMRMLAESEVTDKVLRSLWLDRLPSRMRDILASSPPDDLDALAVIADRIHEMSPIPPRLAMVDNFQPQLEELSQQVEALSSNRGAVSSQGRPMHRRRDFSSPTPQNIKQGAPATRLCWYHQKYGKQARFCRQPCNFNSTNSMGSQ